MANLTFDRVMASAESLPADEQAMLEELLHCRRIETWRNDETAAEAAAEAKTFRAGKRKSASADNIIARLRAAKSIMHELVLTPRFVRAFRCLTVKNPALQSQIEATLRRMAENLADPRLKAHRLSGQLAGLHACSVAYDCRIVFAKQNIPRPAETLLLINIGTHEEVY